MNAQERPHQVHITVWAEEKNRDQVAKHILEAGLRDFGPGRLEVFCYADHTNHQFPFVLVAKLYDES